MENNDLVFDSEFEGGNLDLVVKHKGEYDLYMRTDSNTKGHHQWFYFSVKNKREGTFKFNILNFTKQDSLHRQGMRIAIYSEKKSILAKQGTLPQIFSTWHRGGNNISYDISTLSCENTKNKHLAKSRGRKVHYTLSFEYTFEYSEDTVSFAYAVPYTYTQLLQLIKNLTTEEFVREEVLCKSLGGVNIPLLTITEESNEVSKFNLTNQYKSYVEELKHMVTNSSNKPVVIVTARIHPGETCGSFMMEGFLRFIVSADPMAKELRSKLILKVIPMVNPDGVIIGNYRASLCGQDLNRNFSSPDSRLHPEICAIKNLLTNLSAHNILGYFDFHGHSKKKCVFIYGPYYPLHSPRYLQVRVFANLLGSRTKMFRYRACKYREEVEKMTAARLVIAREFDIMNSFAIEASFYAFLNEERKSIEFSHTMYILMGQYIALTLLEYQKLLKMEGINRMQKEVMRLHKKRKQYNKKRRVEQGSEINIKTDIIRIEDIPDHPNLLKETTHKPPKLNDIYESIRQACEGEQELSSNDSDSAESEIDPLSKEEETTTIKTIIAAVEKFSLPQNTSPPQPNKVVDGRKKKKSIKKSYESRILMKKYKKQHRTNLSLFKNRSVFPVKLKQNRSFYEMNKGSIKITRNIINTSSNSKAFPSVLSSPERNRYNSCIESVNIDKANNTVLITNPQKLSFISPPMQRIVRIQMGESDKRNNEMLVTSFYQAGSNNKAPLPSSSIINSRYISNYNNRRNSNSAIGRTKYAERLKATKVIQGATKDFYMTHAADNLKYFYANYKISKH